MNSLYLEAYEYYKGLYAPNVILFHIDSVYECYENDAECLQPLLGVNITETHNLRCLTFPDSSLETQLQHLMDNNISFTIIEYRSTDGIFTIPKVKQIIEDEKLDY